MTYRVAVVDDEATIRDAIAYALRSDGFEVDAFETGEEVLEGIDEGVPDLIVLDLMLPGLSGMEVCRRVRAESAVPIIVLTARDAEVDRVMGLEAGADDYVTKPFSMAELISRIRANLRRRELDRSAHQPTLRVGDLELDLVARAASRSGRDLELLPREFQLLEYLVRNEGHVVSRSMLLQHVWDLHFDPATNIIDVYVGRLRRKIDGEQAYPLIHTVRGVGYRVCAPD